MAKRIIAIALLVALIAGSITILVTCNNEVSTEVPPIEQFNSFLGEQIKTGSLDKILNTWISPNDSKNKVLDYDSLEDTNGTLVLGITNVAPFAYMRDNDYVGIVIDLAYNFCKNYGYGLDIKSYDTTNDLVLATSNGECDFAGSNISITSERSDFVDFSMPFSKNEAQLVVRTEDLDKSADVSDLSDKKVAVMDGGMYSDYLTKINSKIKLMKYSSTDKLYKALASKEVDAVVNDKIVNEYYLIQYEGLTTSFAYMDDDAFAFIFTKNLKQELNKSKLNLALDEYIQNIKQDGTINDYIKKWENNIGDEDIDFSKLTGDKGNLVMAIMENPPFVFKKDDHYVGLTIDIAYQFCLKNGYKLDFKVYKSLDDLFDAIGKGECDFAGSSISIADSRKSIVNFSASYYVNSAGVFCRSDDIYPDFISLQDRKVGIIDGSVYSELMQKLSPKTELVEYKNTDKLIEALDNEEVDAIIHDSLLVKAKINDRNIVEVFNIKRSDQYAYVFPKPQNVNVEQSGIIKSIHNTFIKDNTWRLFVKGLWTTLMITLSSVIGGSILGFLVYLLCRKGNKAANVVTNICKRFVEGLPAVVVLMIFYYIVLALFHLDGTAVSIIVFILIFAANVINMLKTSVDAIDIGQQEASFALGYTERQTFYKMILPQALQHIWDPYKGSVISLLKGTSIVGYIAVLDLTKISDIVRSTTFEAFFPLITIAILYFLLGWILSTLVKGIQASTNPSKKKTKKFLKGVNLDD